MCLLLRLSGSLRVLTLALSVSVAPSVWATETPLVSARSSLVAACNAWRVHIGDLLDQHRIARDLDDRALSEMVRQFISARNACTPGRYEIGLRMYEVIPLGRVHDPALK
jgi:hypothetical protein